MAFGSVLFLPGLNAGRSCARLRDGFSCVANPECGWCAHKFSCVPGNESGPLSSLRCDGNSSDVELHRAKVLDMNYRVPHVESCTNEDRSKCARYHGPLYTYTADELNATGYRGVNYTYSAPEIWDVLCEAGGMRSSANSTKGSGHTPYWTSQARESATQASTSPPGLLTLPSLHWDPSRLPALPPSAPGLRLPRRACGHHLRRLQRRRGLRRGGGVPPLLLAGQGWQHLLRDRGDGARLHEADDAVVQRLWHESRVWRLEQRRLPVALAWACLVEAAPSRCEQAPSSG